MARICVVGSVNMDIVVSTARLPEAGETLPVKEAVFHHGGKGANAAVAASRLGAEVAFIGRVGSDAFGQELAESLRESGIDVEHLAVDAKTASGIAMIFVDPGTGENRIVVAPGANARMTREEVEKAREAIAGSDAVLLCFETPIEVVRAAARIAREEGVLSVLDAGPIGQAHSEVVSEVDVVSPNETEAAKLTGMAVRDEEEAETAAKALVRAGAREVLMKLGEKGSMYVSGGETVRGEAFPVTPVDTTGAGDAFTAAWVVARTRGADAREALRYANAAGAVATLTAGARSSMPTKEAVERMLREG